MLRCGNEEYFIAGFHNRRTLWANRTIVAENSGHTRIDMRHMLPHGGQRIPYQRTTVIGFYYGEADFPFGEVHDLQQQMPERFIAMQADYAAYANANGVLPMPAGYDPISQVQINALVNVFLPLLLKPALLLAALIAGGVWYRRRRRRQS